MGWYMDFLNKLSKAKKVKVFSLKLNEFFELTKSEEIRLCDFCDRKSKLWHTEDVNNPPACDVCLARLYGFENIKIIE